MVDCFGQYFFQICWIFYLLVFDVKGVGDGCVVSVVEVDIVELFVEI